MPSYVQELKHIIFLQTKQLGLNFLLANLFKLSCFE